MKYRGVAPEMQAVHLPERKYRRVATEMQAVHLPFAVESFYQTGQQELHSSHQHTRHRLNFTESSSRT